MRYLFVDTSAWLALELRNDQHHQDAKAFAQGQGRQYQWLTTNWILSETLTMLRRRTNHAVAVRFGQRIRASQQLSLLRVDEDHEDRAWEIFRDYNDKDFGFVDCTSFAVMEAAAVRWAFAFDRHFRQFGFDILPHLG
jgi:predicted nucleic acid-binding protein